jgi:hypothetical protein
MISKSIKPVIDWIVCDYLKEMQGGTEKLHTGSGNNVTQEFSIDYLKNLNDLRAMKSYLKNTLPILGAGQGRQAFQWFDKVIKIALSPAKIYQNKNEIENSECLGPEFAVQVFEYHPSFFWIIEEKAQEPTTKQFIEKINEYLNITETKFAFSDTHSITKFFGYVAETREEKARTEYIEINSSWYRRFLEKSKNCQFASWDFHKHNWGIRPNGDMVLIDIGFSKEAIMQETLTLKKTYQWLLQEEAVPGVFSFKEFRKLTTLDEISDYLYSTLHQPLGRGVYRGTWELNSRTVLKVPLSPDAIKQNENEVKNIACLGENYAVKMIEHHPEFLWIVEEKLKTLSEEEFEAKISKLLGMKLDWLEAKSLIYKSVEIAQGKSFPYYDDLYEQLNEKNPWFRGLIDGLKNCNVDSHDFHDQNWGIRPSTGQMVLLDLGF